MNMSFFKKLFFFRPQSADCKGSCKLSNEETLQASSPVTATASANCEKLESCPFFSEYKGNPIVKRKLIDIYCCNPETSQKCERKKIFQRTGVRPPVNMTPAGMLLPTAQ